MISILDRYILKEFLRYFIGTTILLTGVALISKTMERLNVFLAYKGSFAEIIKFLGYNIPYFFTIIGAPSLMFAISFSIAMFARNRELSVILSAGRSFYRVMLPIIVFTLFFAILLFLFNEFIAYPSFFKATDKLVMLKSNQPRYSRMVDRYDIQVKYKNFVIHGGYFSFNENKIYNLHIIESNSEEAITRIYSAEESIINKNNWNLKNATIINFSQDGTFESINRQNEFLLTSIDKDNTLFKKIWRDYEEMNIFDLREEIETKKSRGENYRKDLVELYWHYSFPFVCFFIVFIAGLIGSQVKKGAMSASIVLSTLITIVYYLVMFFGKSFGVNGTLPPVIASWLANIFFAIISTFIFFKFKQ